MKKILAIFIMFSSSFSFSQAEESAKETYKRGVIKVRKTNVEILIQDNFRKVVDKIKMPAIVSNSATIVYETPCENMSWMRSNWKMKGYAGKAFNREYVIDAMEVIDCENVTLFYITKGDTTKVKSKMFFEEKDKQKKVTFTYMKNEEERDFFFNYNLKITTELNEILSTEDSNVYDTVSVAIQLYSALKDKEYTLVDEKSVSNHNFFPGVCKEANDTVKQWLSDTKDTDGYRHKITFKSCNEIEILYRNPLKKLRTEKIEIKQIDNENYIELERQRINVPDKYFNSMYGIKFAENKMILSNELETFTYSQID